MPMWQELGPRWANQETNVQKETYSNKKTTLYGTMSCGTNMKASLLKKCIQDNCKF